MDKITIPDLNGTNYFIWELKMKAALILKRFDSLILSEKPEELTHEQGLQFMAEDNAKLLWDKIRATFIGQGEARKIDAGNEIKLIRMKMAKLLEIILQEPGGFD
ncbi:RBR-type E3 ubiquitin transferase [Trichonephila clavipes]|nr:RBR-type E3 ubiquitin transferase [Trichonephila clavipes]